MSLSAAIIVQDDGDRLDACLRSLDGLVDEIVVVDTGSTDDAVAIAERHGAVVAHEPWLDDLAAPRNRLLDLATGDWILSVDADEQVHGDFDATRAHLERAHAAAFQVRFVPRVGWTPRRELRVWRNHPDIRFDGHLHESVVPSIRRVAEREQRAIEPFDRFTIRHDREEGDRAGTRRRDEPLLVAELARNPDQPFVYDHLARVYERSGDGLRAVQTWMQGIEVVRSRSRVDPDDRVLYIDVIHHLLARGVVDEQLSTLVDEARGQFARTPTLELAAARLAFATGRPRDALDPLDWLLALDDEAIVATGASYDERVFGEWAWGLLGLVHFGLGDDAAAAGAFAHAEQCAPDDPSYGVRRRLAEARAASPTPH